MNRPSHVVRTFLAFLGSRYAPSIVPLVLGTIATVSLHSLPSLAAPSSPGPSACPAFFAGGRAPDLAAADVGAIELCSEAFAVAVSPATVNPVYSAERLTPAGLAGAVQIPRVDAFHADDRVPADVRAELRDYKGAPYDRGHMSPAGDMPTPSAQRESFALSNMVPQDPNLNRGLWAKIEERVRREVVLRKEGFVVTGPAYSGVPKRLAGREMIPTRIWKAVYIPADPSTASPALVGAYVVDNRADATPEIFSIEALSTSLGFDPIPGIPVELRDVRNLPVVTGASK